MKEWLTANGIWVFIVLVIGGFIVMTIIDNPLSLQKQCATVEDGLPYPNPSTRRADEDVGDQFVRYQDYKKLVERCKQHKINIRKG